MGTSVFAFLEELSCAHRLDARIAITMLAVYSVGIFFVGTWAGMVAYAALLAAFAWLLRAPVPAVLKLSVPVYVIAAMTVAFNMVHLTEAGLVFSPDGLLRGAFFAARILLLVWCSLAVCLSHEATEITWACSSMMRPLRRLRVPVDDVATVLSIAIRFIPQMAQEYFQIRDAQWSRGAEFDEGSAASRVRAHCAIMVPMFIGMFRRADRLAASMDARCYGLAGVVRTDVRPCRLDARSAALAIAGVSLCAGVSVLL